ncbi:hypothetical protein RFI_03042 [Reticulomyxa filosa]|uniref:Membrane transport protein MMPL domain-containing protein n=1 Tax=Reticulomyxa filosa TaxID=46433 RepID=X6P766_RETFI|nr:hypothetical protein RFI_03042 [Reticulomyxa filosa]|eukprot:ETO34051.1 hypothetical protein RFI_03042 [Reticulomyxa filosa]
MKRYLVPRAFNKKMQAAHKAQDGLSAISIIQHKDDIDDSQRHTLLNWLDDIEQDFNKDSSNLVVTKYTGEIALWNDMQEESKKTIESHLYLVPLILLIFGYTIGSWRLTLIPIVAMVICVNIAFMLLLPFTEIVTVSTMTPTLMTSIALAMCIDYNLFMLVRFREEIGDERETLRMSEVYEALRKTIRWSGEVVLVSGFILALSLMGYIFCSVEFLQSYGMGTAITVGCAISINLTLTPSILLLFPSFFTQFGFNCRRTTIIDDSDVQPQEETANESNGGDYGTNQTKGLLAKEKEEKEEPEASLVGAEDTEKGIEPQKAEKDGAVSASQSKYMDFIVNNDDPFRPFEITPDDEANAFQRCWFVCGTWTTLFPCSLLIIAVVYALILPITVMTGQIEISYAQTLEVPRDSTHWKTFGHIQDHFSAGFIGPMYLLIRAPPGVTVFNYSYINDTANYFKEITRQLTDTVGQVDHVSGVSMMGGKYLSGNSSAQSTYNTYVKKSSLYHALVDGYVGKNNAEAYFVMLTHDDPNGMNCKRIVNRMRDAINPTCKHMLKSRGYRCYYYSNTVETIDAIHDLYTTFPYILLVTMIIIFIIAGIIWKNKFLPLRLFLTIAMPMFMIYGLAVLVYQYSWLSWFNSKSVSDTDGISWIIPLMTITLLFGLALDYDIFLWSRIDEYMKHGVPLRPAIVRGVFKTGSIITAAGLIMAAAFSGLFLSTVPGLNQAGFIMVTSVLVDTFLIRTTLVPSILSISMNVTWHPKWRERVYGWLGWPVPVDNNKSAERHDSDAKDTDTLLSSQ